MNVGGKIADIWFANQAFNEAKKEADRTWEANKTNFNNTVTALGEAWDARNANESAFMGKASPRYDSSKLKKLA